MTPHLSIVPCDVEQLPAPAAPLDLEQAFTLYSRYVAGLALRLLGRPDEVDDVVQDVFLAALRGLKKLREPQAIKGWLATVTVRVARRRLRMRWLWRFCGVATPEQYEQLAATGGTPEDRATISRLYAVLDELPAAERLAWSLRHLEGERLEQVAVQCGCSLATAKRRIAAAHEAIAKAVSDE
jgi:RNA polymerase sigma-70 factor (ECF subfamily)